jgi:serine/threonine protein kinase
MPSTDAGDVYQLAGTTLEGRFVVERVVAEGGFGVVYRAQQAVLERPIALKVLKTPDRFDDAAKQQFLAGFAAEAKTIARFAHPHIVHVYDFGVSMMPSGVRAAWMALEWLTGVTLEDELLARRGRGGRSPGECLALLKPILSALALAHAEGVAHRDIKPANIMLVPMPGGAILKLLDFGIAKIMGADETVGTGDTRTSSRQIAFSPRYASPEQFVQGRSGPWTDVHAMGIVLFELLTDLPAFEGDDMNVLFQQIMGRTRPTPATRGVHVGVWEAVLSRAVALCPADRYADARALLHALESVVKEASSAYVTIPDSVRAAAGLPRASGGGDTLPVISTRDPSGKAVARWSVTTSTPTSSAVSNVPKKPRARISLYVVGCALMLALAGGIGWRVIARPKIPPVANVAVALPIQVAPAPPSAMAAPPAPPPPSPPSRVASAPETHPRVTGALPPARSVSGAGGKHAALAAPLSALPPAQEPPPEVSAEPAPLPPPPTSVVEPSVSTPPQGRVFRKDL